MGFGDTLIKAPGVGQQMGIQVMEQRIMCIELQTTLYLPLSA